MYVYYTDPNDQAKEIDKFIDNKKVIFKKYVPVNVTQGCGIRLLRTGLFMSLRDDALKEHYQKYADIIDESVKYLIIRDEGIGDVIMTTPAIRALKEAQPKCQIDYATNPHYKILLENNPYINKVISIGESMTNLKRIYDNIIDLRMWSETSPIRNTHHRIFTYAEKTMVPIQPGKEDTVLIINQETIEEGKRLIGYNPEKKYVVIQMGSTHYCRSWDEKKFIEVARELLKDGLEVVLIDKRKYIVTLPGVINLTGLTTVQQSVGIIAASDLLISVDTGAYHIAGALKKPFIALFGIISPKFRTAYYKSWHKDITAEGMTCLGCGDKHMAKCNVSGTEIAICMSKISVLQVLEAARSYFKEHKRIEVEGRTQAVQQPIKTHQKRSQKATLAMIVMNEGKYLPRLIDNLFAHPSIKRVVAIDGGSTDDTCEVLHKAGAEVYVHPWQREYHDMVALQRNIMASYIPEGERFFYMDGDEIASKELLAQLSEILSMPERFICLSRRTFKSYEGALNYFETGDKSGQHLNYPDFQPRVYTNDRFLKFFRSPHHITLNIGEPKNIIADILHYERADQKDNKSRDSYWEELIKKGINLGLQSWYVDHTSNRK